MYLLIRPAHSGHSSRRLGKCIRRAAAGEPREYDEEHSRILEMALFLLHAASRGQFALKTGGL